MNEPPDLFVDRLPRRLRERGPHVIDTDNGGQAWVIEGVPDPMPLGLTAVNFRAQKRFDRANFKQRFLEFRDGIQRGVRFEQILAGSFDPHARLLEQDEDHVDAEVLYASPTVWAGVKATEDPELRLACFRAYNDWMVEFTAVSPDRLIGVGLIPNTGIDDAVAELRRCLVDLGLRTVALESYPSGSATGPSPEDDRFWALAEELGRPISLHATFTFPPNSVQLFSRGDQRLMENAERGSFQRVLEALIKDGLFDRFPTLTFVGAEVNCGWIPHYLEQFDASFRRYGAGLPTRLELLPSDYYRRNCKITFIFDQVGVDSRHLIGVDTMMWCSDFPHSISSWPIDVEVAHSQMTAVNDAERDRLLWRTCADLYGLPYDDELVLPGSLADIAAANGVAR
ncbi:amidohydrolase family protein [Frankia canadensis]|uniref:amidohydrolase family protein n=1 Tax=Frankia canadensis TaxID=1836972 RepID=UPI0014024168|nr:amidohydrolase family protein [Frankia canadensis]